MKPRRRQDTERDRRAKAERAGHEVVTATLYGPGQEAIRIAMAAAGLVWANGADDASYGVGHGAAGLEYWASGDVMVPAAWWTKLETKGYLQEAIGRGVTLEAEMP